MQEAAPTYSFWKYGRCTGGIRKRKRKVNKRAGQAAKNSEAEACALCGLPLPSTREGHAADADGPDDVSFCCHGCRQVFLLLSAVSGVLPDNFRQTELYRLCVESGIVPSASTASAPPPQSGNAAPPPLELSLSVEGMWCPSCAWLIEEVLRRTRGVIDPNVSFVSDRLHLAYLPHLVSPDEIVSRIARLGYRLTEPGSAGTDQGKKEQILLALAALLTCNIMMASAVFYGLVALPENVTRFFSYPVLVLTSFVVFVAGLPILKRGFASLRYGAPSMDALVSFGALSAYSYSFIQVMRGDVRLYFDTASMLVVFVLLGRYVETRARRSIRDGVAELRRIARNKVRTVRGTWVQADSLEPGERFTLETGETAPLDGVVLTGAVAVDESFLTGEAAPRMKNVGDRVSGGSAVRDGSATVEATATAAGSLIGRIIAAMEEALEKKDAHEVLADRISRFFVPLVLAAGVCTGLVVLFSGSSAGQALLRTLTVLLIACPCTLGIAIPLVKVVAIGLAARIGVLVRNAEAFERLRTIDAIVFDKTGSLTEGNFSLRAVSHHEADEKQLFSLLASVEVRSRHFIGKEIVKQAAGRGVAFEPAQAFRQYAGLGVKGAVAGRDICIGNRELMMLHGMAPEQDFDRKAEDSEGEGNTCVFFGWEGRTRGLLVFGDRLREHAAETVARLQEKGREVWLVSGDGESTTRAVAQSVGIAHWVGRALPEGKAALIKTLQGRGRRVAMIGDGINDGPALACAEVGCAFGAGVDLIQSISDVAFLSPDIRTLLKAMKLSALTGRTIRQNLFFAFLYNLVAIPVAAAGLLNPLIAVIAMVGSSLTVTGNALRMSSTRFDATR